MIPIRGREPPRRPPQLHRAQASTHVQVGQHGSALCVQHTALGRGGAMVQHGLREKGGHHPVESLHVGPAILHATLGLHPGQQCRGQLHQQTEPTTQGVRPGVHLLLQAKGKSGPAQG